MAKKREYNYVELWKREAIIECALNKEKSIKKCAQELGVKYITAKHIVKLYREQGRVVTKACKKEKSKFTRNETYGSQNRNEMMQMAPMPMPCSTAGYETCVTGDFGFGQNMLAMQTPIQTFQSVENLYKVPNQNEQLMVCNAYPMGGTEFIDPNPNFMIQASTQDSMESQIFCAGIKEYLGDLVMQKEAQ